MELNSEYSADRLCRTPGTGKKRTDFGGGNGDFEKAGNHFSLHNRRRRRRKRKSAKPNRARRLERKREFAGIPQRRSFADERGRSFRIAQSGRTVWTGHFGSDGVG